MSLRSIARAGLAGSAAFVVCLAPVAASAATVHVPEGTEIVVRLNETLSSKTNTEGDRFTITMDDDVKLADGTVIARGYRGSGEVTEAHRHGMMGKAGTLNIRFNYIRIGDARVRLRGSKGKEGDGKVGSVVVLTVLFGPLGLLKKGKDVDVKEGQVLTAYVDEDIDITTPLAAPPADKS